MSDSILKAGSTVKQNSVLNGTTYSTDTILASDVTISDISAPVKQSSFTFNQIEQAINFMHNKVAEPFGNSTRTVNFECDDFCVYNGLLYQCINSAGTSYTTWTAADWAVQKIFDNDGYVVIK